jgi:hypothetical protein
LAVAGPGLRSRNLPYFKVRPILVGKEAIDNMTALMGAGYRHIDSPPAGQLKSPTQTAVTRRRSRFSLVSNGGCIAQMKNRHKMS